MPNVWKKFDLVYILPSFELYKILHVPTGHTNTLSDDTITCQFLVPCERWQDRYPAAMETREAKDEAQPWGGDATFDFKSRELCDVPKGAATVPDGRKHNKWKFVVDCDVAALHRKRCLERGASAIASMLGAAMLNNDGNDVDENDDNDDGGAGDE